MCNDFKTDQVDFTDEVFSFHADCSSCGAPCDTKMKMVDIPYFKEVVLMSTCCDNCGYKSNEVKSGGAVAEKGRRIILRVTEQEDLSRDMLKV
jgi:zinc finger protein